MKQNKIMILLSTFLAFLFLQSCGTLSTKNVDQSEIKKIQTFAVAGYSAYLPSSAFTNNAGVLETSLTTDQIYDNFNKKIEKILKAKAIKKETLRTHTAYKNAYKSTMEGWQNKMPIAENLKNYHVESIMDKDGLRLLDQSGRDQLMTDLKVDALITFEVRVNLKGFTVAGIGTRKPQSSVHFKVYKKGIQNPVWFDSVTGEESTDSVGSTGFINETLLQELSLKSFNSALDKMTL